MKSYKLNTNKSVNINIESLKCCFDLTYIHFILWNTFNFLYGKF